MEKQKQKKAYRKLETDPIIKGFMFNYYAQSKDLPTGKKIVWVTSGAPVEPLIAMDLFPLYPENYGAVTGAAREAVNLCQAAENQGYSQDLCSYARNSIGSLYAGGDSLMGGLTEPDMLVVGNNICGVVLKWFQSISRYYRVPMFVFDTPFLQGTQEKHHLDYTTQQLEEMIQFVEKHTGQKFNEKTFEDVVLLSVEAVELWSKILESCKTTPSPLNCADRLIAMGPVVCQRGMEETVNCYEALLEEVQTRVKDGLGAIYEEKTRLLFDNIPMWFNLYKFFNTLAAKGVVFPADTYTHAWSTGKIASTDPFTSMAQIYSNVYLNRGLDYKIDLISQLVKDYNCDGFVLHSAFSCKRYSLGQPITRRIVQERTKMPGVIIDGDICDSRMFSEEQTWTRLESLLEIVNSEK
ncbi:MAG: 2-hydroxyacyl-CoA dehydratase subunit D [Promethearchaeota archaeon]